MKKIYEINIFKKGEDCRVNFIARSKKRAKEFILNVLEDDEEAWIRTWKDTNRGIFEIESNEKYEMPF